MKRWLVAILAALFFVGTGVAVASIPAADGTINGCYKNSNGALRVIDSSETCDVNETPLDWNQEGAQGPAGPGITGVHRILGSAVVVPGVTGDTLSAVADCPEGEFALSGAGQVPIDGDPDVNWALQYLQHTAAWPDGPLAGLPRGYVIQAHRFGGPSTVANSLSVRVMCAQLVGG